MKRELGWNPRTAPQLYCSINVPNVIATGRNDREGVGTGTSQKTCRFRFLLQSLEGRTTEYRNVIINESKDRHGFIPHEWWKNDTKHCKDETISRCGNLFACCLNDTEKCHCCYHSLLSPKRVASHKLYQPYSLRMPERNRPDLLGTGNTADRNR